MFRAIKISKSDPTPLYIQLASEISALIQTGILLPGMKLPAIRSVASNLKINRDTVVSAYKLLENQGLAKGYIGRGTYVADQISKENFSSFSFEEDKICCSSLSFPKELYPISLCKDLVMDILLEEGWQAFSDPLYRSRNLLKQNICGFLKYYLIKASPAQIRIVKNYEQFLLSLFRLSPKQGICVEKPRDLTYSSFLKSMGVKIYEIPVEKDGINLECLEKYLSTFPISYILLSPYVQNPTGICYSQDKIQKIIQLAHTYNCFIIEDGTYSSFACDSENYIPIVSQDENDNTLYVSHFSKVYLPYLNYTFVMLPPPLAKRLCDTYECTFNDRIISYYLKSDHLTKIQEEIHEEVKIKYNLLHDVLLQLKDKIEVYSSDNYLFLWLRPLTISFNELNHIFMKHHVIVSPGSLYSIKNHNEFFRLSLSNLSIENIMEIRDLLKQQT